jgi:hypothetical protein
MDTADHGTYDLPHAGLLRVRGRNGVEFCNRVTGE